MKVKEKEKRRKEGVKGGRKHLFYSLVSLGRGAMVVQTDCTEQLGGKREVDREMSCRIPGFMEKACVHLSIQGQMSQSQRNGLGNHH